MKRPNLIYVFADQLRYQSVGYAGDRYRLTPNIDTLRGESVDVCQAISGHPVCAPYRASLFTGKYTTSTGMVINEIRMNTSHHTFADVLNEHGYKTSYIGKWHMYAAELGNHYDSKNSYIPKGRDRLGFNDYFAAYNFRHEYEIGTAYYHLDSPEKIFYDKYEPDAQTEMAVAQLQELSEGDRPFAMFLSYGTPHDPWVPENVPADCYERVKDLDFPLPPNYLPDNDPHADNWAKLSEQERAELGEWMRCYYAMLINLDQNIGRLMQEIKRLKLDDSSIIVFTSDHGELFGAHGRRAKNIFYEEAVRVPFLVKWKNHIAENSRNESTLNSVDIMPSLLTMMGLPVPREVEGEDLSAYLLSGEEYVEGALLEGTGPTAVFGDGNEWRAYRTKHYTYAVFKSDGLELLFDNLEDPYQMRNLAELPKNSYVKDDLRKRMWGRMDAVKDTFENNLYYRDNWIEDRIIKRTATLCN